MSIRTLVFAVSCTALCPPALAETFWQFSYTGFQTEGGANLPSLTEYGYFEGEDVNGNGVVELAELSRFIWRDTNYALNGEDYCNDSSYCELKSFSYHLSGELDFVTAWRYIDERSFATADTTAGVAMVFGHYGNDGDTIARYLWTPQTVFRISPPPIPEPAMPVMLLVGLATLAASRRWRHVDI